MVENHEFVHLSAGDLLRAERDSGSEDAELINSIIKEGKIVPVEITVKLIRKAMKAAGWEKQRFLIDGFPRNQENVDGWNSEIGDDADVIGVLFFYCDEETMLARIMERSKTSGRNDDNEEAAKKRFKTYEEQTMPVVRGFEERGKVF